MKRILLLLTAMLLLLSGARSLTSVALQPGDDAHCNGDALMQTGPLDAECVAFTPTPAETPTPTATVIFLPTVISTATDNPTVTPTPLPTATPTATTTDTATPTATATNTPAATSTPTVTPTPLPRALWPLCPTQDLMVWSALDDPSRQCHYDSESGDNPALGDAVFGPVAANYGGMAFMFPWHTSPIEMTLKRGGMKVAVLSNQTCPFPNNYDGNPANCITDARVVFHEIGASIDALARYHTYYAEYRICKQPAYFPCGIIRFGGWLDMGILEVPYAGPRVYRPGGTIDFGMGSMFGGGNSNITITFPPDDAELNILCAVGASGCNNPYWASPSFLQINIPGFKPENVNSMNHVAPTVNFNHNKYLRFLVRIFDGWDAIDPASPNTLHFFTRDGSGPRNASNRELAELSSWVDPAWDTNGDGLAEPRSGFTDRFGVIVSNCSSIALDCVPYSVEGQAPVGYADTRDPGCECHRPMEYDTSPAGKHWIQFPN